MPFIILQIAFVFWNFCPFHPFCPEAVLVILGPSYSFHRIRYMHIIKGFIKSKIWASKQFFKGKNFKKIKKSLIWKNVEGRSRSPSLIFIFSPPTSLPEIFSFSEKVSTSKKKSQRLSPRKFSNHKKFSLRHIKEREIKNQKKEFWRKTYKGKASHLNLKISISDEPWKLGR